MPDDTTPEGWVLLHRADGGEVYVWCEAPIFAIEAQQDDDDPDQTPATAILTNGDATIYVSEAPTEVIRLISEVRTPYRLAEMHRKLETPGRPPSR